MADVVDGAKVCRLVADVGNRVVFDAKIGREGIADAVAARVVDNVVQKLVVGADHGNGGFIDGSVVGVGDGAGLHDIVRAAHHRLAHQFSNLRWREQSAREEIWMRQ